MLPRWAHFSAPFQLKMGPFLTAEHMWNESVVIEANRGGGSEAVTTRKVADCACNHIIFSLSRLIRA